jgi:outer membrane protein assembly factor BamB
MTALKMSGGILVRRALPTLFLGAILATSVAMAQDSSKDWPQFGFDVSSSSSSTAPTGINAANVTSLARVQVPLDGIVDSSVIYLHSVTVKGAAHDVFFATTTYGKTIAIDASQGTILWEFTPAKIATWSGTRQITNSIPVADPDRKHIYAAAPDGTVQKLAITDGSVVWTTSVTLLPEREKIDSALKVFRGRVIAVTGGYIGDRPPYQGHVAILDAASGKLLHVWNSLCSDRSGLLDPTSCNGQRSAIWGRPGAVIDPATGNLFVATGNGTYDGKTNWADATIELNPDATEMIGNYTPENNAELDAKDADVGSTSPFLLGDGMIAQGGKDGTIRLLSVKAIAGASPHAGNELQVVQTPGSGRLLSEPAVWHHGSEEWIFAADSNGTSAWTFEAGKLVAKWNNSTPGTSPVVAGGLLFIYNPKGGLNVYDPASGKLTTTLETGTGHWNSPIVIDGGIALPEGNANQPNNPGVLDIWRVGGPLASPSGAKSTAR